MNTITGDDWKRSLADSRAHPNALVQFIASNAPLPADFTIELAEYDRCRLDFAEMKRMQASWEKTKAELIRRGYEVMEWVDQATFTSKARCRLKA